VDLRIPRALKAVQKNLSEIAKPASSCLSVRKEQELQLKSYISLGNTDSDRHVDVLITYFESKSQKNWECRANEWLASESPSWTCFSSPGWNHQFRHWKISDAINWNRGFSKEWGQWPPFLPTNQCLWSGTSKRVLTSNLLQCTPFPEFFGHLFLVIHTRPIQRPKWLFLSRL